MICLLQIGQIVLKERARRLPRTHRFPTRCASIKYDRCARGIRNTYSVRRPCFVPPVFDSVSAHYLAFSVVSISRQQLVMRRPLPILATIVANKYSKGILAKPENNGISQRTEME